jgi:hypothetical protein
MAKQTFSTGQVLTAAQMTSLQQTAMLGGAASAKVASYTLVAADAGTAISMSNAGATTITVNTALFAAGDTVHITNLGAGVCTITAGTATVNTSASLALAQYESGFLDFTSTSAAIFVKGAGAAASSSPASAQTTVATYESTSSTSYTGFTTATAVTLTTGTKALVTIGCAQFNNNLADAETSLSFAISGATTSASSALRAMDLVSSTNNRPKIGGSRVFLMTGLTAGSNTFTMQIKVSESSGGAQNRSITVVDMGS